MKKLIIALFSKEKKGIEISLTKFNTFLKRKKKLMQVQEGFLEPSKKQD